MQTRRGFVLIVAVAMAAGSGLTSAYSATRSSGHVRGVVALVGDSNITFGATATAIALTARDEPYAVVNLARPGAAIRTADCSFLAPSCATFDFWNVRLAEARAQINPSVYVVDLGVNDTYRLGTATTPGFAAYGAKIDAFMPLFRGKPVLWTNLPCTIEPPVVLPQGCQSVNNALAGARARWTNLTVLDWASVADGHAEYMLTGQKHYSDAGHQAWARLVANALDKRFSV